MMKQSFPMLIGLIALLFQAMSMANAQLNWRFGFEFNEWAPWWGAPHLEQLLTKLEKIDTQGGINVNGVFSWAEMQDSASAAIKFDKIDPIVKAFQSHGFSLTLYLRCDANWAFPGKTIPIAGTAAPDPAYEHHWINFVKAIVEHYDGDGTDDMPDLLIPIEFYIHIGEIKFGIEGTGDRQPGPFWFDSIDNLLHLHRITYQAIHEADPSGNSKVVSSGAVLWDLYADFPDWPEFDPTNSSSVIQKRLRGENYRNSTYTAGWDSVKKMLTSFGNDADGIECDYIGWHPHFNWRVIPQEFALIHAYAGNKPIYVDDMWTNIFSNGYNSGLSIPGGAQFHAPQYPPPGSDWMKNIYGDFPNALFTANDPHSTLFSELLNGNAAITDWYYQRQARELVKSFVTAFGEGAERVCLSGTNDAPESQNWLYGSIGWINILGTRNKNYPEKAGFYTYKLLVDKLKNFTDVSTIAVSPNPLTRCYKFDREFNPPIYVLWSETGLAPPNLNYSIPTGDTVTFLVDGDLLYRYHIITDILNPEPEIDTLFADGGYITIPLGYEPIILEALYIDDVKMADASQPHDFILKQNYPNPFNPETAIEYQLPRASEVEISIFNLQGQKVTTLVKEYQIVGTHKIIWNGIDESDRSVASGVYLYRLQVGDFMMIKKMLLLR